MPAAKLGSFAIETRDGGATLEADVVEVDTFRLSQEPLTARVQVGRARYVWPVVRVSVTGSTLLAQLGPREP